MAELDWEVAKHLAASLVSIGHPYNQAVIDATALDLVKWCKGAVINGKPWSAEQQAEALVEEARTTWEDGWPEKGGTVRLLQLFRANYAPKRKEQTEAELIRSAIARGYLAAPCALCLAAKQPYCEFGGEKRHALNNAERAARAKVVIDVTVSPKVKPSINLDQLQARAAGAHEEEQRRKREQLEKTGCT